MMCYVGRLLPVKNKWSIKIFNKVLVKEGANYCNQISVTIILHV